MTIRHKKLIWIISICICVLIPIGILFLNMGIGRGGDQVGGCTSVVFDKIALNSANRILVYEGNQVSIITEKSVVGEIVDMFLVADCTDMGQIYTDRYLEIYSGNSLVRTVRFSQDGTFVKLYDADMTHWVFGSTGKAGQLTMSTETMERLNQLIKEYGD